MDALKRIVDYLALVPWWISVPLVVVVGTLIWLAWKEGREISFWPPRIGPRLGTTDKSTSARVTDISVVGTPICTIQRTVSRPATQALCSLETASP